MGAVTARIPATMPMEQAIEVACLLVDVKPWVRTEDHASWRWNVGGQDITLSVSYDIFDRPNKQIHARVTVSGTIAAEVEVAHEFAVALRSATATGNLVKNALSAIIVPL